MKIIFTILLLLFSFNANSQDKVIADLTCEGFWSCPDCKPSTIDAPMSGQFVLMDMKDYEKNLIIIRGIPEFFGFSENDQVSTGNILEFGEIKTGEKFGQIDRVTGELFLAKVEFWQDGKGGKFSITYDAKCKKTEKLF